MKTEYDFSKGERGRFYLKDRNFKLPDSDDKPAWNSHKGRLGRIITQEVQKSLNAYREQPKLITEHAGEEQDTTQSGYAHRQLFELVQNSADALLESRKGKSILIRLKKEFLYCADDGAPINEEGVYGLMFDRMSNKRNTNAIGRFGRGFKSVLRVSDAPEFYSRSVSLRFDKRRAEKRLAKIALADSYPALRLPEPIDPHKERDKDEELGELMSWATNVVRLPLKKGAFVDLADQIRIFPPEFLLFVDHVRYLTLEEEENSREFMLHRKDGELIFDNDNRSARWKRFDTVHSLSADARADWHLNNDSGDMLIQWATPLDSLDQPGHFWAIFPTSNASLVPGILNAPWKTNEDRQNLLAGTFNHELIEAAAALIAANLPKLASQDDPARHLDALPCKKEAGDTEQIELLRNCLIKNLHEREIIPDQSGALRMATEVNYPPEKLTKDRQEDKNPFERWEAFPARPMNWLHHRAITRNRLARIDRFFESAAPRATVPEWLEALVKEKQCESKLEGSRAAVQTAASIPKEVRLSIRRFGNIVLTAAGTFTEPDSKNLFLPDESPNGEEREHRVHSELVSDTDTLQALKVLGLKPPTANKRLEKIVEEIM